MLFPSDHFFAYSAVPWHARGAFVTVVALKFVDELDLEQINRELAHASALDVIRWSLSLGKEVFASTSFGPNAAVMLDLISTVDPSIPIVWVDTGYNLRDTYVVADKLIRRLPLNLHVYTPRMTAERWNAVNGGVPQIDEKELHEEFTRRIKIEPFERALDELSPGVWLTGIRREETEHRRALDVVSRVEKRGMLKVAPIFYWTDEQVEKYRTQRDLPTCRHYFDPTKVLDDRECGLHTDL